MATGPTMPAMIHFTDLDWEFAELRKPLASGRKSPPTGPKLNWLPASVPGCFHLDLMSAGLFGDPFCAEGEAASSALEGKDWIYRTTFDGEALRSALDQAEGQLTLVFEGLDTFASIWLNGKFLGETDNMFIPWEFDVTRFVRHKSNELLVTFASAVRRGRRLEQKHGVLGAGFSAERSYVRKAQCHFGWDWGPRIVSAGIWRPGRICFAPTPRIEDFGVQTLRLIGDAADVEISGCVSNSLKNHKLRFEIRDGDDLVADRVIALEGRSFKILWRMSHIRAWWPWSLGVPKLYRVRATLLRDGEPLHSTERAVGFRTISIEQKKDRSGKSFCFKVNGKPFFARGANWIPPDVFPARVSREDQEHLLSRAVAANMDMLRVWGGGYYESEEFYQTCDRLGLLVWQDFMFACAEYPETRSFRSQIRREAESVVRRLRHHPCIAIWCGNNENEWGHLEGWFSSREKLPGRSVYEKILPDVCRRLDPSRPYWQSSPFGDAADPNGEKQGDRHNWLVWSQWQPYENYRNDKGRFVSEFGFQSLASPDLWKLLSAGEPQSVLAPELAAHQKQPDGDGRLWRYLVEYLRLPRDFEDYCFLTQLNQAEAMRVGIEHWRRRWPQTAGALLWQMNDCWPAISWSLVDYSGAPKLAYYSVACAFAPVALSVVEKGAALEVWLVVQTGSRVDDEATLFSGSVGGESLKALRTVRVKAGDATAKCLFRVPTPLSEEERRTVYFFAALKKNSHVRSEVCLMRPPKWIKWTQGTIIVREITAPRSASRTFAFRSTSLVKCVWLRAPEGAPQAEFSDNAFTLIPGVERRISSSLQHDARPNLPLRVWTYHSMDIEYAGTAIE